MSTEAKTTEQTATYAVRGAALKTTGHYRRPGTQDLYCARPAGGRNDIFATVRGWHLCAPCVKAEARDRAEAQEVAEQHQEGAAEQAEAEAIAKKLTPKMRATLPAVAAAASWPARAGLAELPVGVTYPSLQALIRRDLVEEFKTGESATDFRGQPYEVMHHRISAKGRAVLAVLAPAADPEPGTWHAAWIGKQAAAPALFNLAPTSAEQGALFQ
jgi:hypothetical protein